MGPRTLALFVALCVAAAAAENTQQAASAAADYLVAPGAQGHPFASQGGGRRDAAAEAGREDLITLETTLYAAADAAVEPYAGARGLAM